MVFDGYYWFYYVRLVGDNDSIMVSYLSLFIVTQRFILVDNIIVVDTH